MKKTALLIGLLLIVICFTSCIFANNANKPISEIPPEEPVINVEPEAPEAQPETEKVVLTLYFPDSDALYLHKETREVEVKAGEELSLCVIEELFKGPENENLSLSLDGENLVNSVSVQDGLCTVDFKYDFVVLNTGGTTRESFAIASIVNSLCELDGVDGVEILIDGNKNAEFGHTILESVYEPITELIAK